MKLWYLGDSILRSQLQDVANALNLELVDSSAPAAPMEDVWTRQVHEPLMRGRDKPNCHAVLFVDSSSYDSECLISQILQRAPNIQKVVLIVSPKDAIAGEGMTAHWSDDNFILIGVDDLTEVAPKLLVVLQ